MYVPHPLTHTYLRRLLGGKKFQGKNLTKGKKKKLSVAWILKSFIWSPRLLPSRGILAGSAYLQTDLWNCGQFPSGTQNGSNTLAQLAQYSGQPRFQGTCAFSFSDVSLKRYIPIFLWIQSWLLLVHVSFSTRHPFTLPASLLDLKDHYFMRQFILPHWRSQQAELFWEIFHLVSSNFSELLSYPGT